MRRTLSFLQRIIPIASHIAKIIFDGYFIVLLAVIGLAIFIRSIAVNEISISNPPSLAGFSLLTPTPTDTPGGTIPTRTPTITLASTPQPTATPPSPPTPASTPTPPPFPTDTPTPAPTLTPPYVTDTVYISADSDGTVDDILFSNEDILAFEGSSGSWSLHFDGSDVVPVGTDVNAFAFLADDSILLSFNTSVDLPDITAPVDPWDIVRFTPVSLGNETAGAFQVYFDGSDVALDTPAEDIDALDSVPDGRLLISTIDDSDVDGLLTSDDDILLFTPTSLGENTSGSWQLSFDGADVGLTDPSEDVWGVWVDAATLKVYLTTEGPFAVDGASGNSDDIFICAVESVGSNTTCTFGPGLYWDGSDVGFGAYNVDGFTIDS